MNARREASIARVLALIAVLSGSGCYHARIEFPQTAPPGLEPRTETLWSFAWGLSQQNLIPPECPSSTLSEVTSTTNFGFVLLTVVTLGTVSAVQLEYRCAKLPSTGIQ